YPYRHARQMRGGHRVGAGFAALCAALLTLGLSAPTAPADAAQTGVTATENDGGEEGDAASAPQAEEGPADPSASTEGDDGVDGSVEKESNADDSPAETTAQESQNHVRESAEEMTDKGNSSTSETSEKSSDDPIEATTNPTDATTSTETGSVPGSVLTVAVSDTKGEPVAGVAFTLWQETNDVAQLQQQGEADATEEAWTCRTSTAGTCAVGEDQGRHSLSPGTYYWVQTDAPEGSVTPAEQPVATAQITEAEAGTDLQPARVRVAAEAAPEEDESATEAPSHPSGADEEAAPLAEAEEEPDAGDPEGEGAEDPSATEQPAGESGSEAPEGDAPETEAPEGADADGDTPESLTVEGSG